MLECYKWISLQYNFEEPKPSMGKLQWVEDNKDEFLVAVVAYS